MEMQKGRLREKKKREHSVIGSALRGLICALLLLLLLLAVFATVAMQSENPSALIAPLSYTASLLSALFCGFISARMRGKQGLLCGLTAGALLLAAFALGLLAFAGEGDIHPASLLIFYPALFTLAVFGGVLGGARRVGSSR